MSNDGITEGVVELNLPPALMHAELLDGSLIALHATKWDGVDCKLLDRILPYPFCKHLLNSPVFFTGEFKSLRDALTELTCRACRVSTSPAIAIPKLPFSFRSNTEFNMSLEHIAYCDRTGELDDEYNHGDTADHMSCDEDLTFNLSSDDEDEFQLDSAAFDFE